MVTEIEGGLRINLERKVDDSYNVRIGSHLFPTIAQELAMLKLGSKYAIITDSNVKKLYAGRLSKELDRAGLEHKVFSFKAGEKSKTQSTSDMIIGKMHTANYGRDTCVIALGGGVVGDQAGYVAAILNRGVPFVQVPTTTVSQADSAVGGKVGVDTPHGKNLVGAFYNPKIVFIDVTTLDTLPRKHYVSGLAESIKHGIIYYAEYFDWLEKNAEKILMRDRPSLIHLARQNCRIKGNVVEQDPNEKGLRRILNYGHTIGHALEKISNYTLMHGDAVSIGMMAEGIMATSIHHDVQPLSLNAFVRQGRLLHRFGLKTRMPRSFRNVEMYNKIVKATMNDKKAAGGKVRYCLPEQIGQMQYFGGEYATPLHPKYDVFRALRILAGL